MDRIAGLLADRSILGTASRTGLEKIEAISGHRAAAAPEINGCHGKLDVRLPGIGSGLCYGNLVRLVPWQQANQPGRGCEGEMTMEMTTALPSEAEAVAAESLDGSAMPDPERMETMLTVLMTGIAVVGVSVLTVAMNLS
jgi:hypothetical protein